MTKDFVDQSQGATIYHRGGAWGKVEGGREDFAGLRERRGGGSEVARAGGEGEVDWEKVCGAGVVS